MKHGDKYFMTAQCDDKLYDGTFLSAMSTRLQKEIKNVTGSALH
jgi:hypothetical protein